MSGQSVPPFGGHEERPASAGRGGTPYSHPFSDTGAPEYRVGQLTDPLNDPLDAPRTPSRSVSPGPGPNPQDTQAAPDPLGTPRFSESASSDLVSPERPANNEPLARYDDELSRPRASRPGPETAEWGPPSGASLPSTGTTGYPEYSAPTVGDAGLAAAPLGARGDTWDQIGPASEGTDRAAAGEQPVSPTEVGPQGSVSGLSSASSEGGLGTGSGNTWAFSRDDYSLQELRKAALDAVETRQSGADDQGAPSPPHPGSGPGIGPFGDPVPGQAPPTERPVVPGDLPGGGDPFTSSAAEQTRARPPETGGPEQSGAPWPNPYGAGGAGPPVEGTQAMPAIPDELGPDHRGRDGSAPVHPGAPGPATGGGYGQAYPEGSQGLVEGRAGAAAPLSGPTPYQPDPRDGGHGTRPGDQWGGPAGHEPGAGEYGHATTVDHGYGGGMDEPGYDGSRDAANDPGIREYDGYHGYRDQDDRESEEYDQYDGYRSERNRRSHGGPVEQDFPDFDDQPLGGAGGDAYPGYDNLEDDYWPDTDRGATTTLWLGILALIPVLGLVGVIGVFIVGPKARTRIRRSGGELEGQNLVLTGTILACVGIAITFLVFLWGAVSFVTG